VTVGRRWAESTRESETTGNGKGAATTRMRHGSTQDGGRGGGRGQSKLSSAEECGAGGHRGQGQDTLAGAGWVWGGRRKGTTEWTQDVPCHW
jgi:hypothetical protein